MPIYAYCRVSTDSTEQLASYYDASDSVKKVKKAQKIEKSRLW